ncbi:hypothetical protein HanIR_Chr05g0222841 [Helianthus annuus]|nr:hypothetical protein HanIR_Chr05g0222841 [Helianthus annuus]
MAVEERSLTAHRISEDNLVSESDARDISNKTNHWGKTGSSVFLESQQIQLSGPSKIGSNARARGTVGLSPAAAEVGGGLS